MADADMRWTVQAKDVQTVPHIPAETLCLHGEAEVFKFSVHLGLFGLALTCCAYNSMSFSQRKDRHLFVNAVVYFAIAYWESRQMHHHLDILQGRG